VKTAEATKTDIPVLCSLLEHLFAREVEFTPDRSLQAAGLRQIIDSPEYGRILTLHDGPSLVGMVSLLFTISTALGGRVALLEDMIIHPDYRNKGAGTALLLAAVNLARSLGCHRITLLTDRTNESAQRFYGRCGFKPSGMVPMRLIIQ
jgi:GNAT superfamily N-acetyltransferase